MLSESEIKKSHRNIILTQCAGLLAMQFLGNGFVLNYIKKFGVADGTTMLLLTFIPNLLIVLMTLPLAHLSDKVGMKKIGNTGNSLQVLGFGLLTLAYFYPSHAVTIFVLSILIYSFGFSLFASNWFALIDPLVKPEGRGRFFAVLRIIWQLVGIVITFIVSSLIVFSDSKIMYLWILAFITVMMAVRIIFYVRIPEVKKPDKSLGSMKDSWRKLKKNKVYIKFCWYSFFMTFLASGLMTFFNLFEKGSLGFSESQIVIMGFVGQGGAIVGFWAGAMVVDRKGNEVLFSVANVVKLLIVGLFVFIKIIPLPAIITAGCLTFMFGFIYSAFGIGATAEALKRVDDEAKSFGIGVSATMAAAGGVLASLFSSQYLKFGTDLSVSFGSLQLNHYELYLVFISFGYLLINLFFRFKKEEFDG
jgi:MFS family permease